MNPPRVLAIDNSTSTCLFISAALQRIGCEVDVALSGQEGLAKIATFQPHCLILDVFLPDVNGYALCRHIRQNIPAQRLPLIMVSAKNTDLDIKYGLRQGANRYLPKPFTAETLIQNVWEIIPVSLRSFTPPTLPAIQSQRTFSTLLKLTPRRTLSHDAMQMSNPLASAPAIKDKLARQLFAEIDGKKTVARLAAITGLEAEDVAKALRVLLDMKRVLLYDEAGQCMEEAL